MRPSSARQKITSETNGRRVPTTVVFVAFIAMVASVLLITNRASGNEVSVSSGAAGSAAAAQNNGPARRVSTAISSHRFAVVSVNDGGGAEQGNGKSHIIDGDDSTRWAKEQIPSSVVLDLGTTRQVGATRLSFYKWDQGRDYTYAIDVSTNGSNWSEVRRETSQRRKWNVMQFGERSVRYVRIRFLDANNTGWAGLWEAEVWSSDGTSSPPPPATPRPQPSATPRPNPTATPPGPAPTSPPPPPGGAACTFTNPNDPKDDPNPAYSGGRGRYRVSNAPVPSGYPTPLTTGICGRGIRPGALTVHNGSMTVTQDGAVINRMDIEGKLTIRANNVKVRNSRITSSADFALELEVGYTGLVVEDTRIRAVGRSSKAAVRVYGYATFRRAHMTGGADVLKASKGVLVEGSYLSGTYRQSGSHNDVVQIRSGSNYIFRNNSMFGPWQASTSVFIVQAKDGAGGGPIRNVTIEDSYLSGGGFTVYTTAPDFPLTNAVVRNNRFERNSWAFGWRYNPGNATYSGNVQIPS